MKKPGTSLSRRSLPVGLSQLPLLSLFTMAWAAGLNRVLAQRTTHADRIMEAALRRMEGGGGFMKVVSLASMEEMLVLFLILTS